MLGKRNHIALGLLAVEDQRELIAGQPREGVLRADQASKPSRRHRQEAVACLEAEALIDGLEAIEIDHDHIELAIIFHVRPTHGDFEPIHEQSPVGQAGHAVANGIGQQTFLGPLPARDIAERSDTARSTAVRSDHGAGAQQVPAIGAVVPAQPEFLREGPSSTPFGRLHRSHVSRPVARMNKLDPGLQSAPRHRPGLEPKGALELGTDVQRARSACQSHTVCSAPARASARLPESSKKRLDRMP